MPASTRDLKLHCVDRHDFTGRERKRPIQHSQKFMETHAMKFSLIYEAQTTDASREGDHRVFKETVEQALLAEEMGFDTVWCVEHISLTNYAHMSAPETFLAYLAGRTTRIGLGHGVICLPP